MKAVCIFLAEGFEEMEAMFPLDIMRRGGLNVKTVSVTGNKTVISSHQVPIVADLLFEVVRRIEGGRCGNDCSSWWTAGGY